MYFAGKKTKLVKFAKKILSVKFLIKNIQDVIVLTFVFNRLVVCVLMRINTVR